MEEKQLLVLNEKGEVIQATESLPSPVNKLIAKLKDNANALFYHLGDKFKFLEIECENEILFIAKVKDNKTLAIIADKKKREDVLTLLKKYL